MSRRSTPCMLALCSLLAGCTGGKRSVITEGQVTKMRAEQYIRDAVRMSNEGVVLEPASNIDAIDRVRLVEFAQALRTPAAVCFLERAIATMEPGIVDGEPGWINVPEGQIKVRARVSADGTVASTDVLQSGFTDDEMEVCLGKAILEQRFLPSRDNFAYHIDVFYWVSLGFFRAAQTAEFRELLRREQTAAGIAGKNCLAGRVGPGEYPVTGLNLFDRDGNSVINRIERGELPPAVGSCVATAFKAIHIPPEPEAFVRPAAPSVTFTVAENGEVSVSDERWLALIEKEDQAVRDARKAELLDQPIGSDRIEPDSIELPEDDDAGPAEHPETPDEVESDQPPMRDDFSPTTDPGPSGLKIDLSPRRRR